MDNTNNTKKNNKALIIVIVAATLCAVLFCVLFTIIYRKINPVTETVTIEQVGPIEDREVRTSKTIKSGIEELGTLVTASYWYQHAEYFEDSKTIKDFKIPFTTSSFILECSGCITAGVNFENAEVDIEEGVVTIRLPKAEIFSNDIDADSFEVRDEKNSIFNKISVEDTTETFKRIEDDELKKALNRGILDEADANAIKTIKSFVSNLLADEDYEIKVETQE